MPLSCSSSRTGAAPIAASHSSRRRTRPARVDHEIGGDSVDAGDSRNRDPRSSRAQSPPTPCRSSTPGSASTSRRNTHSKVVRRHAIATRSSSPGRGDRSVSVSGNFSVKRSSAAPASSNASSTSGARSRNVLRSARGTRASDEPAARRCAATRTRRRRNRASECRHVRGS